MNAIRSGIWINAPVERCFLLSLSIDLHVACARKTGEKAIAGVTTGLIGEGETVTFQGRHFLLRRKHTSRIELLRPYSYFRDVMVSGSFKRFEHDHHFAAMDDGTRMRDEIRFTAPWGVLGRVLARRHLKEFLKERNAEIKRVAESEEWHKYLDGGVVGRMAAMWDAPVNGWNRPTLVRASPEIVLPHKHAS
jgi:hypothetical protein